MVEFLCKILLNFIARFSLRKKRSKLKGTGTHFVACRYNKEKDRQKRKRFIQGTIEKDIRKKKEKEDA